MSDLITLADAQPIVAVGHRPGVTKRSIVETPSLRVEEIFFEAGVATDDHGHAVEQAAYHVSGTFEISIGGSTVELTAGDGYSIPPNEPHAVRCVTQGSYLLVSTGTDTPAHGGHQPHHHAHANGHS